MVLTTVLSMLRYVGEIDDRDFVDRLHSYFTTNILIAFAILVSFKQFGGKPVECLVPDLFSGAWEQYAENYCWAQDTYYVPMREVVDGMPSTEKRQRRISYYQWVPFFLLIEAACFRLPSLLWKYMAGYSGIKINEIVKLSADPNNIKPEIKKANIKSLTVHLQGALRFHRRLQKKQIRPHHILRLLNIPYTASFVTSMYILTKLMYLCNVCVQLLIMNSCAEAILYMFCLCGKREQNGSDKQISAVDLGALENEENSLRLRRNVAGKEPPSPTVKLNKENDELTKLISHPKIAYKQISAVDLGALENEENSLRLRRNVAGKEPPSPTVKLNKENDELTKLISHPKIASEAQTMTFSAGSPIRAPKTPPKPVLKDSPKKVPNLVV
ncbi:Innexin-10 [Toxocara canis]|uniref:Innexin n=1 Tax=Toxocara canis TaxID=6265 RepID=A0A0B2W477_TOXCA|nr:Innexin-10 [Toxocara canis]